MLLPGNVTPKTKKKKRGKLLSRSQQIFCFNTKNQNISNQNISLGLYFVSFLFFLFASYHWSLQRLIRLSLMLFCEPTFSKKFLKIFKFSTACQNQDIRPDTESILFFFFFFFFGCGSYLFKRKKNKPIINKYQ